VLFKASLRFENDRVRGLALVPGSVDQTHPASRWLAARDGLGD